MPGHKLIQNSSDEKILLYISFTKQHMIGFNPSTPWEGCQKTHKIFKSFQNIMLYISDSNTTVLVSASMVTASHNAKGMKQEDSIPIKKGYSASIV